MAGDFSNRPISIPVKAVVRGRPLIPKEINEGCQTCLEFIPNANQIVLRESRPFTFDHVFGGDVGQEEVYNTAVKKLTKDIFKGYHAAVIAYGQTGSGKTYSMGSAHSSSECEGEMTGVIPRVISDIFKFISENKDREYTVKVSYLELYKRDLHDLLNPSTDPTQLTIRDAPDGGTVVSGLSEVAVSDLQSTLHLMEQGNSNRTTAATAMNLVSSRSHAIFTIILESVAAHDANDKIASKFHLVDLAGSERAKRTKAEGERLQEGIKINEGLLALGNVISALADENTRAGHIRYRDSKLTRILQGSLGGNSHTLMIACVSPADSNYEETLNTLRYADRVRKIKNAPVVNRDPQAMLIASLRKEITELNLRLLERGDSAVPTTSRRHSSESYDRISEELEKVKAENVTLSEHLQEALQYQADMCEKVIVTEISRDQYKEKLIDLTDAAKSVAEKFQHAGSFKENLANESDRNLFSELMRFCENATGIQIDDPSQTSEAILDKHVNATEIGHSADVTEGNLKLSDKTIESNHAMKNADLGKQLQSLTKTLALKEEIAKKLASSDTQMVAIKEEYEKKMQQLDKDIQNLAQEKANLEEALQNARKTNESKKLSEKRRQRVKELEAQIQELRKEKLEKEKLLRIKAEKDRSIDRLNTEIRDMKRSRVSLMKQIRAESEKFNNLKREKAKELKQLQEKNRKRNVEYVRLERTYDKQKAILRRKTEEAAAANKRLRETLNRQTAAASKRRLNERRHNERGGQKISNWLEEEIELATSIWEAEHHLAMLIDDRKLLTQELQRSTDSPGKRRRTFDCDDKRTVNEKRTELHQEIKLKNAQIQAIQAKLTEAKERHGSSLRWSTISTFADAKCALKNTLQRVVDEKAKLLKMTEKLSEIEREKAESDKALRGARKQVQEMASKFDEEKTSMQKSHQDEMSYYVNKFGSQSVDAEDETVTTLRGRIAEQQELVRTLQEENKILHRRLLRKEIATPLKKPMFFNPVENAGSFCLESGAEMDDEYVLDEDEEEDDCDPTPRKRPKRTSGSGCSCRSLNNTCKYAYCGCVKRNRKCGPRCGCAADFCTNRENFEDDKGQESSAMNVDLHSDEANTTFDVKTVVNLCDESKLSTKPDYFSPTNKENHRDIIPRTPLEKSERTTAGNGEYKPFYFSSPLHDAN